MIALIDCGSLKTPEIAAQLDQYIDVQTIGLYDLSLDQLQAFKGVVISGAPILLTEIDPLPYVQQFGWVKEYTHPLLGICFGHQLIAQALGGTVAKSKKGWGVGVNAYAVDDALLEQADGKELCLLASHQDQVMQMPPGAKKIATNAHCEVGGMVLGEHILTFQGHPEFTPEYARAILSFRHDMIGEQRAEEGLKSLVSEKHEGARAARWILDFLRQ